MAVDAYLWADSADPRFMDIVGPYRRWEGDNADSFYGWEKGLDPRSQIGADGNLIDLRQVEAGSVGHMVASEAVIEPDPDE